MTFKENAKTAVAKVLSDLIQSDGIVNQGEIVFLRQAFKELKIDGSHLKKSGGMTLADAITILKKCGIAEKTAILHAIQRLSGADGDIDPSEVLLVAALTLAIGIPLEGTQGLKAELVSIPAKGLDLCDAVLYVEPSCDKKANRSIIKEYDTICQLLEHREKQFFYLPMVMKELNGKRRTFRQMLRYIEPLLSDEQLQLIMHDLKDFGTPTLSKELFLNQLDSREFHLDGPAFLFKIDNMKSGNYQDLLLIYISSSPLDTLERFYRLNDQLMSMPKGDRVDDELSYTGVHKIIIDTILKFHSNEGLSRLRISEKGRLYLVDRNNAEVKVQTIGRALYILYLRHEEGIALTELNDHRDELMEIYATISNYNDMERLQRTVDNLVDYVGNTINPLLSRIKKSFTTLLGEQAKDYWIEGNVSEAKRINLPRSLVIDEFSSQEIA